MDIRPITYEVSSNGCTVEALIEKLKTYPSDATVSYFVYDEYPVILENIEYIESYNLVQL